MVSGSAGISPFQQRDRGEDARGKTCTLINEGITFTGLIQCQQLPVLLLLARLYVIGSAEPQQIYHT